MIYLILALAVTLMVGRKLLIRFATLWAEDRRSARPPTPTDPDPVGGTSPDAGRVEPSDDQLWTRFEQDMGSDHLYHLPRRRSIWDWGDDE